MTSEAKRGGAPGLSLVFGALATAAALGFDVLFMKFPAGGLGYLWYLTTVGCFAGGGFAAARRTTASRGYALRALTGFGVLYGVADIGLSMVLENNTFTGGLFIGVLGALIACISINAGFSRGARRAPSEADAPGAPPPDAPPPDAPA